LHKEHFSFALLPISEGFISVVVVVPKVFVAKIASLSVIFVTRPTATIGYGQYRRDSRV